MDLGWVLMDLGRFKNYVNGSGTVSELLDVQNIFIFPEYRYILKVVLFSLVIFRNFKLEI